jgi:hypothetical protein
MQSSRGLPNITHQPLLGFFMKTHDNKHIVVVRSPNKAPHPRYSKFQTQSLRIVDTPHTKHTICQNLSLARSLVIFIIPPSQIPTPSTQLHYAKGCKAQWKITCPSKIHPSTPPHILPSNATRYCSLYKH